MSDNRAEITKLINQEFYILLRGYYKPEELEEATKNHADKFVSLLEKKIREAEERVISDIYSKAQEFAANDETMRGSEYLKVHHWTNAIDVVQEQLKDSKGTE